MTDAELIAKIKAEIERLENYYTSVEWYVEALLSFLSTLESEKERPDFPITNEQVKEFLATHPKVEVPEKYKTPDWIFEKSEKPMQYGLEEEINRYLREECSDDDEPSISDIARHFAEWGAEHLKK